MNKKLLNHRLMEQLEDRILFDAVPDATFLIPDSDRPIVIQEQVVDTIEQQQQQQSREY